MNDSKAFQSFVVAVIILSALSIGAHTYNLPVWAVKTLNTFDIMITVFFLFELVIRYFSSNGPKDFFKSGWNIFDTLIVIGSLIPATGSTVLLARLLRIFRVLRLVSMVPELKVLVNSLIKAMPRMGYIALLMFVIFYIYAAIGSILFSKINPVLWGDVSISMLTLFRVATFEDWTDVMYETMAVLPLSWTFYISFIFLTAFVFLNMMVGTILDVMAQEQEAHRAEKKKQEQTEDDTPATVAQVNALRDEIASLKDMLQQQKP
ncbi:ion transporter [Algicola sagamiensis]|uniref:ion transporter n=1 Tax=Algicola sagamiensis TaxID=163869 RepID=UPI0003805016